MIVYATGSLADQTFGLVVQTIADLHTPPSGVPTGAGDFAEGGLSTPLLALLLAFALGGVVIATPRAVRRSR